MSRQARPTLVVLLLTLISILLLWGLAQSQGLGTSPYSAPSMVRGWPGQTPTFAPAGPSYGQPVSPFNCGNAPQSIYVPGSLLPALGICPPIPNLQFGLLYDFGQKIMSARGTADYVLPGRPSLDSTLFAEAHTEIEIVSFWPSNNTSKNRSDLSVGGGFRTLLGAGTLIGANGFYDGSYLNKVWYSSQGAGFELAHKVSDSDAIDINANWYGKLFNDVILTNASRAGSKNWDLEVGYSHELWEGGPDFRVKATGYQLDTGIRIEGWNTGAELKSRDGVASVKYEVGNDKLNKVYQTIGAFFNCGFQLDRLFCLQNPFSAPEPLFKSPRNLRRMLTQNVKRDWHQSSEVKFASNNTPTVPPNSGYFSLSLTNLEAGGGVSSQTDTDTHSTIILNESTPQTSACIIADTISLCVVGGTLDAPVNAMVTTTGFGGAAAAPCFTVQLLLPDGTFLSAPGASGNLIVPTSGCSTWTFPGGALLAISDRTGTCFCGSVPPAPPDKSSGLAGTLTITDLSGNIPTLTVDVVID